VFGVPGRSRGGVLQARTLESEEARVVQRQQFGQAILPVVTDGVEALACAGGLDAVEPLLPRLPAAGVIDEFDEATGPATAVAAREGSPECP